MVLNLSKTHKKGMTPADKAAPMPAGPFVYREDGNIDWGNMWNSFCVLAQEGGPPHRGDLLEAPQNADTTSDSYHFALTEIARGVWEVAALTAVPATPGWLQILCQSEGQARWLAEAIIEENVPARHEGQQLFVPVGDQFRLEKEIKNVITAVAKTSHNWQEHLAVEIKQALAFQDKIVGLWQKLKNIIR
jgi:sirohydrochlorin cobaltochelatase